MNYLIIFLSAGVLVGLHLFFVVAAVALKRTSAQRMRELSRHGCSQAKYARIIRMRSTQYILSAQVGVFLTTLLLGFVLTSLARAVALTLLANSEWQYFVLTKIVLVCAIFGVVAFLALVLVQMAKAVGRTYPEQCLCFAALPFLFTTRLLRPFVWIAAEMSTLIMKPLGLQQPNGRDGGMSPEEISQMLELSSESGQIEEDEREMIERVISFSETLVKEVMTPRSDIVWVRESSSLEDILQTFAVERLSRVVVIERDLDEVRGILHAKDLIQIMGKPASDFELASFLRKPYFIAGNRKTGEVLRDMRENAVHLAIVTDEHGGVDGLITIEDLVEEIVGEILDEYDSPHDEIGARRTKGGDLILDGAMLIDDINTEYKLGLPLGAYDTLAGFVAHTLGRIPLAGEFVRYEGLRMRIEKIEQNRIIQVRLMRARRFNRHVAEPSNANPEKVEAQSSKPLESQAQIARISNSR